MAVYDTVDNKRTELTLATLRSLAWTVDWTKHRLYVCDNGSCEDTYRVYQEASEHLPFKLISMGRNAGTANAINQAWRERSPGEHTVKMDNDVVFHQRGWADWMADVFTRDEKIGICGLKRKDLEECPWSTHEWYKSEIRMLPHERGQRWIVVEKVQHVMGTCQAYNSLLLDKIGYLFQPSEYAFDDSLAAVRASVAGFESVFLHGFEIDHDFEVLPPGEERQQYTDWKRQIAGKNMNRFVALRRRYESGARPIYYNGGFES